MILCNGQLFGHNFPNFLESWDQNGVHQRWNVLVLQRNIFVPIILVLLHLNVGSRRLWQANKQHEEACDGETNAQCVHVGVPHWDSLDFFGCRVDLRRSLKLFPFDGRIFEVTHQPLIPNRVLFALPRLDQIGAPHENYQSVVEVFCGV